MVTREYKTFLATSRLVSGIIHVVIVCFEDAGWTAYFCTDAQVDVPENLETVAARWDNPDRRPSHIDPHSTIAREMLGKQFPKTLPSMPNLRKFKSLIKDVISLCI